MNRFEKMAVAAKKESSDSEDIAEEMTIEYDMKPDHLLPSVSIKMEGETTESKTATKRRNIKASVNNRVRNRRSDAKEMARVDVSVVKKIRQKTKREEEFRKKEWKSSHLDLKDHEDVIQHTGEMSHKCGFCEETFPYKCRLDEHLNIHTGTRPHKCRICRKTFFHMNAFKRHLRSHEGINLHKCRICQKSFARSDTLKQHSITHTISNKRPYKCRICLVEYLQKYNLKMHILSNHSTAAEKSHKCSTCSKTYFTSFHLRKHVGASHPNGAENGQKILSCKTCGKRYSNLHSFKFHQTTHGGRSYKCSYCKNEYHYPSSLRHHIAVAHLGKRPHKCGDCGKAFAEIGKMKQHVLNIHRREMRPHKCNFCVKAYSTNYYALKTHMAVHSTKGKAPLQPHECGVCIGGFENKASSKNIMEPPSIKKISN